MARKRLENKKWRSRPSRKKSRNRNKKPCKIRKNNSKLSCPTKLSQQRRKVIDRNKNCSIPSVSLETKLTEEMLDARITHNFLSERYDKLMTEVVV